MVGRSPNQTGEGVVKQRQQVPSAGHCPEEQGTTQRQGGGGVSIAGTELVTEAPKCRARLLMELGDWSPGVSEPQLGTGVYR